MNKKEQQFQEAVWRYYREHGRTLPWRNTRDPYKILISEIMLQQTQVERVIPKYKSFLKKFPIIEKLASASLAEILKEWQGLGYNRRAKMLHVCARIVNDEYNGRFPTTYKELQALPGVGTYTAGAVMIFAYNKPIPVIETNIRTVYLHHFFKDGENISDRDVIVYVEKMLDQKNPREWYAALMDYGSYLKKAVGNQNTRSRHYAKQSAFKGSDREIRGALLKELTGNAHTTQKLYKVLTHEPARIKQQLDALKREGFIILSERRWQLQKN